MTHHGNFGSAPTDPTENARWHRDRGDAQRAQPQPQAPQTSFTPSPLPTSHTPRGGVSGVHPYEERPWMGTLARLLSAAGFLAGAFLAGAAGVDAGYGVAGALVWGIVGGLAGAVGGWFLPLLVQGALILVVGLTVIAIAILLIYWIAQLF